MGWSLAVLSAGAIAAAGGGGLALLGLPFLAGCVAGLMGHHRAYLVVLVGLSGIGFSWATGAAVVVADRSINPSGLHWGLIALVSGFLVWRAGRPTLPKPLGTYASLVLLAFAGMAWTPDRFEGVKNAIQFAAPLLVALLALAVLRRPRHAEPLRVAFWIGLVLSCTAAVGVNLAEPTLSSALGLAGALGNRGFAIYLVPLFALALAGVRYRTPAYLVPAFVIFAITLLTLSRMALLVMMVLAFLATSGWRIRERFTVAGAGVLAVLLALQYQPLRDRVFTDRLVRQGSGIGVIGSGGAAQIQAGGVELSGRGFLWLQTARHGLEKPVLGHGTGSSTHYLKHALGVSSHHPHNDYLRLFHDLGAVGLALGLFAVVRIAASCRRLHREARTRRGREWALAAGLSWAGYALLALTDNVMIYVPFFTQNVFLLLALAYRARVWEEEELGPATVAAGGYSGSAAALPATRGRR